MSVQVVSSLPPLLGAFSISCLPILLDTSHPLYLRINGYLTSRPQFNHFDIPLFMTLFWSDHPDTFKMERAFAVQVRARTKRDANDAKI